MHCALTQAAQGGCGCEKETCALRPRFRLPDVKDTETRIEELVVVSLRDESHGFAFRMDRDVERIAFVGVLVCVGVCHLVVFDANNGVIPLARAEPSLGVGKKNGAIAGDSVHIRLPENGDHIGRAFFRADAIVACAVQRLVFEEPAELPQLAAGTRFRFELRRVRKGAVGQRADARRSSSSDLHAELVADRLKNAAKALADFGEREQDASGMEPNGVRAGLIEVDKRENLGEHVVVEPCKNAGVVLLGSRTVGARGVEEELFEFVAAFEVVGAWRLAREQSRDAVAHNWKRRHDTFAAAGTLC